MVYLMWTRLFEDKYRKSFQKDHAFASNTSSLPALPFFLTVSPALDFISLIPNSSPHPSAVGLKGLWVHNLWSGNSTEGTHTLGENPLRAACRQELRCCYSDFSLEGTGSVHATSA